MRAGTAHPRARALLFVAGVLVLCLPLAGVSTLALLPFWSRLEASARIESIGHSGPAAWCYQAVYVAWVTLVVLVWKRHRARRGRDFGAHRAPD